MSTIAPQLLEILVCPLTKTRLTYDKVNQELISEAAGLAYPVNNGVPIMLVDEARIVNEEKAAQFRSFLQGSAP